MSFVVWGTEGRSLHCVCPVRFIVCIQTHTMNEYLNQCLAAPNTRASAALGELALIIPRCGTDQFSPSFLPAAVRLWNLLSSGVINGGILNSFKSAMNL